MFTLDLPCWPDFRWSFTKPNHKPLITLVIHLGALWEITSCVLVWCLWTRPESFLCCMAPAVCTVVMGAPSLGGCGQTPLIALALIVLLYLPCWGLLPYLSVPWRAITTWLLLVGGANHPWGVKWSLFCWLGLSYQNWWYSDLHQ